MRDLSTASLCRSAGLKRYSTIYFGAAAMQFFFRLPGKAKRSLAHSLSLSPPLSPSVLVKHAERDTETEGVRQKG